jgi:hypothetical protein
MCPGLGDGIVAIPAWLDAPGTAALVAAAAGGVAMTAAALAGDGMRTAGTDTETAGTDTDTGGVDTETAGTDTDTAGTDTATSARAGVGAQSSSKTTATVIATARGEPQHSPKNG